MTTLKMAPQSLVETTAYLSGLCERQYNERNDERDLPVDVTPCSGLADDCTTVETAKVAPEATSSLRECLMGLTPGPGKFCLTKGMNCLGLTLNSRKQDSVHDESKLTW
jgi:hypothetical protein